MSRRRAKSKRRYSDEDRANALAALAANGGNIALTARQLGIPRATLQAWRDGATHPEAAENSAPKKAALADRLEELAGQLLDGVTADKIACAGPKELLTSAGIAVDKMQLLRGHPTAISDQTLHHDDLSDEDLDARIAELEARVSRPPGGTGAASSAA